MTSGIDMWRAALICDESEAPAFEEALEPFLETVARFAADGQDEGDGGLWLVEGVSRHPPDRPSILSAVAAMAAALGRAVPDVEIERLPARDWLTFNLQDFPPIRAGRYFVHGSHVTQSPPISSIALEVDAGTAFGSGEHASTKGCLLALDQLFKARRFRRPLDLGCGSGILGLAVALTTRVPVLATDIDPEAARVANLNAARNRAAGFFKAIVSDGWQHPRLARLAPYDLILANILARPLMRMAKDLAWHLAPGGTAVLAGLLDRQERMVLEAHRLQGLSLQGRIHIDGWCTLILKKPIRGRESSQRSPGPR